MEENKYDTFIRLLNFNNNKYSAEKVFNDFISLYAISLSNKVVFNEKNNNKYNDIYNSYDEGEHCYFYALSAELKRLFLNENTPYDILGEIHKKISNRCHLRLLNNKTPMEEMGKKLQGIININNKTNNGKMLELNCGSGAMILAYASTMRMFKYNYNNNLEVTAVDTNIINVFMTYIQLYFYNISAIVILVDEKTNQEIMKLYTPVDDYDNEIAIAA